jgi:uncharacterized protein YcbK (DUF882 family)
MIHIKSGVNICNIHSLMGVAITKTEKLLDRLSVDMVITSATRNELDNRAAGGRPDSKHLTGLAIDIRIRDMHKPHVVRDMLAMELKEFGYDVILEKDHMHIEYDA